ncbi:uncharacterized protein LOC141628111 [Silene latifolia]|uniref:uncharacterized protein LOC141628111 n=1 Tax=Silene latifolia TaxID=37657 RepID=UPI003D78A5B2
MKKAFLEKYFPPSRSSQLKRAIINVEQQDGETMYEYLEKFKKLCASCPYHGNIANKNPDEAWEVISELAETSRQFERKPSRRGVSAMTVSHGLKKRVDNIVSTLRDMLSGRQMATESTTNNRKWDTYSKTYNEGWKAHPNFRWGNSQAGLSSSPPRGQFLQRPQGQQFTQQVPQQAAEQAPPSSSMSTEDMIRALSLSVTQDRADNKQNFKNLENQVSQLATAVNPSEAKHFGALPSQTVENPRKNVSAVSFRNGRQLVEVEKPKSKSKEVAIQEEEEIVIEEESSQVIEEDIVVPSSITKDPPVHIYEPTPPFPEALKDTRKKEHDNDVYETFHKCEVNIPLLELLKSVPQYAMFLKELFTIKRNNRLKGAKKVKVSEYVSAMFKQKLPTKCGDPGMFTIPCTIGDTKIHNAMLDLGASINLIPHSIYQSLKLGPMSKTNVVIQLADRSNVYPKGIVEDVLVMVDKLIFPVDFYVLGMEHDRHATPILLGRPFMKTTKTRIDVFSGSLTMEFDGQVVEYNIFDAMKFPNDDHSLCFIDTFEPLVQDTFDFDNRDEYQVVNEKGIV